MSVEWESLTSTIAKQDKILMVSSRFSVENVVNYFVCLHMLDEYDIVWEEYANTRKFEFWSSPNVRLWR